MTISVGDTLPAATFKEKTTDGPADVASSEIFAGKRVVLFAVPGAFTPTCSLNHLPGYLENYDAIRSRGIDELVVVAVNDVHVMGAWATASGGINKIRFLSDWNAEFTKAIGMDIDLSKGGMGVRSKRYSMVVEDGVVKSVNLEENPGQATVSAAAAILEQI